MSSLTVIKFYCDDEIKRVPMNRSLGDLTYDELCVIVQRIWKDKLSTNINNLVLKYVDDEGDQICLESDNDVNHALSFSSCLKVHVYDKETIPVNSKSLIPNLTLEKKTLESIKNVVKSSRDTLDKILEQLDNIKVEGTSKAQEKTEIKPLSTAELSEFLGEHRDSTNNATEEITSAPAVADQTISSAPLAADTTTATTSAQSLDQTTQQSNLVQTPNSIQPTLAAQPPAVSSYNQASNTPQLAGQTPSTAPVNNQSFASPTTSYPPPQSTSQANASSMSSTTTTQHPYQKTNSYSSNMSSQPATQANSSSSMYASAPPPSYGSSYTAPQTSQYGSTTSTSQYGSAPGTTQYGSTTSSSAPPPASSAQYPPPPSSTASSTTPYQQNSTSSATNPSSFQRYPQTPTYGANTSMSGPSVPPPPQGSTYAQKPYGYGTTPYGQANTTGYGANPYGAYNNQSQAGYPGHNNTYGQGSNPYY